MLKGGFPLRSTRMAAIGSGWGLRPAVTLMQVSGRSQHTQMDVRLREVRHTNDVNGRPETLATSSMERT